MKIAFLGTGLMGFPMAKRLCAAGYELNVYNRSKNKAEELVNFNANVCDTPAEAIINSDTVIIMLSDYYAVCSTLFNLQNNSVSGSKNILKGKTVIQMSTISPDENILLKDRIEKLGAEFFEAPVLGSLPQIEAGKLVVLVGSEKDQFEKYKDLFNNFGDDIIHFGEVGKASSAKLALNQMIISLTSAFSMSLGYVMNMGVDVEKFMSVLRKSALYAPTFDKKLDNMLNRDFKNPNFPVKHLLKDAKLMNNQFAKNGINNLILESVIKILKTTIDEGYSEYDYSALYNSIHPEIKAPFSK